MVGRIVECGWFNIGLWLAIMCCAKCFVTVDTMLGYGWRNVALWLAQYWVIVGSAFGDC